ncbi:CRISPR-associated protein [Gemmata sp. SH-PL17]|nr:CRISPR-associated protein [Gemmata sp. SH-PL17]
MSNALTKFDSWLDDSGPAALVIREPLVPVEGKDGVLFPATFAAAEDKTKFAGGYNIDTFSDGTNICLVDSVGSQANRIEPIFAKPEYAGLVPQIVIMAGSKAISLLEAGHRAGDAIVRCSTLKNQLQAAFKAVQNGDAEPLAQIAPTSLVFGVWDSRDTQAKLPRLVASTIRAFNVKRLLRSAQFVPATEYVERELLDEPADKKTSDAYAERGFVHVPASGSHGGVIAEKVRRDATLSIAALRLLAVREAGSVMAMDRTRDLRRYILGLALVALTAPQSSYLRQGCNLVPDTDSPREFTLVHADGRREKFDLRHPDAITYAQAAAKAFKVADGLTVEFNKSMAKQDITGEPPTESEASTKKPKRK